MYRVPVQIIGGRTVEGRAQEVVVRKGLEGLVRQMAELVDSSLEPKTYRGGSIVYQESLENPDDWEIAVVTRLAVSGEKRFDISLRIGETLSRLIASEPYDHDWMHVTFSLELA